MIADVSYSSHVEPWLWLAVLQNARSQRHPACSRVGICPKSKGRDFTAESKGESEGTAKPSVFSFGHLHSGDRSVARPECLPWCFRCIFFHIRSTIFLRQTFLFSFVCSLILCFPHLRNPGKDYYKSSSSHPNLLDLLQTLIVIQSHFTLSLHLIRKQDGLTKPIEYRQGVCCR